MADEHNEQPVSEGAGAGQPTPEGSAGAEASKPADGAAQPPAESGAAGGNQPPTAPGPAAAGGAGDGGRPARKSKVAPESYVIGIIIAVMGLLTLIAFWKHDDPDAAQQYLRYGLGAICTMVIFSFLYKENPVYRFFEHVLVGLGVGYAVGITFFTVLVPKFFYTFSGKDGQPANYLWLLCIFPGMLWYFQLSKKRVWLSRLIIAFFLGVGAGQSFKAMYNALIGPQGDGQLVDSFRSFLNFGGDATTIAIGANTMQSLNNFIFLVVTVTVLSYFFFSYRHEGNPVLRHSARTGRYLLMIAFGAIFGGAVMGRMALLIGRLDDLTNQWFWPSVYTIFT